MGRPGKWSYYLFLYMWMEDRQYGCWSCFGSAVHCCPTLHDRSRTVHAQGTHLHCVHTRSGDKINACTSDMSLTWSRGLSLLEISSELRRCKTKVLLRSLVAFPWVSSCIAFLSYFIIYWRVMLGGAQSSSFFYRPHRIFRSLALNIISSFADSSIS